MILGSLVNCPPGGIKPFSVYFFLYTDRPIESALLDCLKSRYKLQNLFKFSTIADGYQLFDRKSDSAAYSPGKKGTKYAVSALPNEVDCICIQFVIR